MSAKRFATWFFVGEVTGGEEVADGIETDRLHWFRPADAFAARDAGEIELAPPQYVTLLWLRDHATVSTSSKAAAPSASTTKTSPTTTWAVSTTPARATASTSATPPGSTSANSSNEPATCWVAG
jgi:hypothetical protein